MTSLITATIMGVVVPLLALLHGTSGDCTSFQSSICGPIIDSYPQPGLVYSEFPSTLPIVDSTLTAVAANITLLGPVLFPKCYDVGRTFICSYFFPPCSQNEKLQVCQQTCDNFYTTCAGYLTDEMLDLLPNCTEFPTTNCSNLEFVPKFNYSAIVCPAPLILSPDPSKNRTNCPGNYCCLPCPEYQAFYPTGSYKSGLLVGYALICAFSLPCLFVFITYIAIPEKRKFPQSLIIFFSGTAMIVFLSSWMGVLSDFYPILCYSEVDMASASYPVPACFVQGIFLVYGVIACIAWFAMISVNIFFVIVMGWEIPYYFEVAYHCISWIIPIIPVAIAFGLGQMGAGGTMLCGINSNESIINLLLIPTSIGVFPFILTNIALHIKIFQIARRTKKTFLQILNLEIRPFILTTYCAFIFVIYWIYTRIQVMIDPNPNWLDDWFYCVAEGQGQDACAQISQPHLPTIPVASVVNALLGSIGLVIFFVFGMKVDVLEGWQKLLGFKRKSLSNTKERKERESTVHLPVGMEDSAPQSL